MPLAMPKARGSVPGIMELHGLAALALKNLGVRKVFVDGGAWKSLSSLDTEAIERYNDISSFLRSSVFLKLRLTPIWTNKASGELHILENADIPGVKGEKKDQDPMTRISSSLNFDEV